MMPTLSRARMQTLRRAAIARASTTLNINQQVSASIGTAVLSVLLANALADRLPGGGGGGIGDAAAVPPGRPRPDRRARWPRPSTSTFWWALALVVIALVVSTALLPKEKPEPVDDPADDEAETPAPVLVG